MVEKPSLLSGLYFKEVATIKKLCKNILSILIILALVVSSVSVGLSAGDFFTSYPDEYRKNIKVNLSDLPTQVDRLLAVAIAQEGNYGQALGYRGVYDGSWCAAFVSDSARIAGISKDIIPKSAGVADMYNKLLNDCGAEKVTSPQKGDILFYYCDVEGHEGFKHAAIVDTSEYSIQGNLGDKCQYIQSDWYHDGLHRCRQIYVRPNYAPVETHTHSYYPYVTAPTCTEKGYTTFFCSCGDFYTDLYINATGHDYQNIANIPAGCATEGEKLFRCSNCNDSYVISQPAKGHSAPVWGMTSAATCTQNGERTAFCSDCGSIIGSEVIPATGHSKTYEKIESEPTANHVGIKTERCVYCDDVIASSEVYAHTHVLGYEAVIKPATCTEDGIKGLFCSECNACYKTETIQKDGHGQTISVITKAPSCTLSGEKIEYCTVCEMSLGTKAIAPIGHDQGVWIVTNASTCTEAGEKVCRCSACGLVIATETIKPEGHGETYRKIDFEATADHIGQISERCVKCHKVLDTFNFTKHEHKFGYSAMLLEPTCLDEGENGLFCAECLSCYATEVISPKGHNESVWTYETAASCTVAGEKHGTCPDCGEIVETKEMPALGHDEGTWIISVPPTCTTAGEETRICTRCVSVIESREIPAVEHDDGVWMVSIKPTCFEKGEEILVCTTCGETIDSRIISETGHDVGVWKVDFEPTPDHEGQMSRYCSICDSVLETKNFSAHDHVEGYRKVIISPTCTNDGEGGVFCEVCGIKFDSYVIPALEHIFSEWYMNNDATHSRTCSRCHYLERNNCEFSSTVYPPTCTKGGYTEHICVVCTFKYVDAYTDPLGHDWSDWVEDYGQDTHTHVCQRGGCDATETKPHNWSEWVYEDKYEDICPYEDTMVRYCPDCGAIQRKEVQCKPCCIIPLIIGGTIAGATITGIVSAWNTTITTIAIGGGVTAAVVFLKYILPELQKLHSVTYKVDGEVYRYFIAKEGGPVPVPEDPEGAGREFIGWEPEVPEVMPDHDLEFEAKWKEREEGSISDVFIPQTGSATSTMISVSVTAALAAMAIVLFKKKKED